MKPVASWPLLILAIPAFVAVWSGWVGLGELTGFGVVHPLPGIADKFAINSAITLPVGVETYAAYALRACLSAGVSESARRFARWSALGSLTLGAAGQVAYHLMQAQGMKSAPWWITTLVACLPVAVLGMGATLAHLLQNEPAPDQKPTPTVVDTVDQPLSTTEPDVVDNPTPALIEPVALVVDNLPEEKIPTVSTTPRPVRAVKRVPTGERIARIVAKTPDATPAQIAARLDLSERTIQRYLSRLTADSVQPELVA